MMETEFKQVVDSHFYQISGYKDEWRTKVISRSFVKIIFTDFETCMKLIKP